MVRCVMYFLVGTGDASERGDGEPLEKSEEAVDAEPPPVEIARRENFGLAPLIKATKRAEVRATRPLLSTSRASSLKTSLDRTSSALPEDVVPAPAAAVVVVVGKGVVPLWTGERCLRRREGGGGAIGDLILFFTVSLIFFLGWTKKCPRFFFN